MEWAEGLDMSTSRDHPDRWAPQRTAVVAVFLWPLVITAAGVLCYLSFVDQLPGQVATHWSRSGPDGFTARESVPWFGLLALVMGWLTGAVILAVAAAADGTHRRLAVGFTAGLSAFMIGVMVGTAWDQRGLSHGSLARDAEWPLVVALLGSIIVGGLAALTVPGRAADSATAEGRVPTAAPRAALPADGHTGWTRLAVPSKGVWIALAVLSLVLAGTALLTRMWVFSLLLLVLTVAAMLAFSMFRVTVGESGLTVRSIVGVPRWRLPLEEVVEARVTKVNPLWEFGGWGYRVGTAGRTGFVVRSGEALEVERGNGTSWVVTVDDATEGAALLNSLADRGRR